MAIFDLKENRAKAFAEFLQNKFGKPAHEVTKDELLSQLTNTDFENLQWKATSFGSAVSIYGWYGKNFKGTNTKFAILRDLGYAERLNITEKEVRVAASARISTAKTVHADLEKTRAIFLAFFGNIYGKGARITKRRLVAIGKNAYANKKYFDTPAGNAHGLFMHYARAHGVSSAHFRILKDLGLAAKYRISEQELKDAAAKRIVAGRVSQYSDKSKRQRLFAEFLRVHFGKPAAKVSKEELLSLRDSDMLLVLRNLKNGSIGSLYGWYQKNFKGTITLFAILNDLGYADRLGISKKETEQAVYDKMSESIRAAGAGGKRKVIIKPQQRISEGSRPNVQIPQNVAALPGRQVGAIEIVMSTTRLVIEGTGGRPVLRQPPIVQAIQIHFGAIDITRDSRPLEKLSRAAVGFTTVITSQYPLDEIYKKGLRDLGYEILDENVTFKTGNREADRFLKSWRATRICRAQIRHGADPIMFKNDYRPDKTALHILGEISRKLKGAQTPSEVGLIQASAINWLFEIREGNIIEPDRMRYVEERYGAELLKAVQRRIGELLEKGHARAAARAAETEAAAHNAASECSFWRITPLLDRLKSLSGRSASVPAAQGSLKEELSAKHSILQSSRTRSLQSALGRKLTAAQARVATAQARELLLH